MRKAQLFAALDSRSNVQTTTASQVLEGFDAWADQQLTKPPSQQSTFDKIAASVKFGINKFADWLLSYVPEKNQETDQ